MQVPVRMRSLAGALAAAIFGAMVAGTPAAAYTVYVSNEKGNSLTVIDSKTLEVQEPSPSASARAASC